MAEGYRTAALSPRTRGQNRRACRLVAMSDKVALSDVHLFIVNHAQFEPANRRKPLPGSPPRGPRTRHWRRRRPSIARAAVPCPRGSPRSPRRRATTPAPRRRQNTTRAYAADWRHYCAWARRQNLPALPPDPQVFGLYIAACASGAAGPKPCSVSTIERRLSALMWNFAQRGQPMDRKDRHVATVLAGIRRTQGRPPEQKEAILPEDLLAMIATLELKRSPRPARPRDSARSVSPAASGARKSSASIAARRTASAAAGSNFSTTDCC